MYTAQGDDFHEYVLSYWPKMYETKGGTPPQKLWRNYENKVGKTSDAKAPSLGRGCGLFLLNFSNLLSELMVNKGDGRSWLHGNTRLQRTENVSDMACIFWYFLSTPVMPLPSTAHEGPPSPENGPRKSKCMKGTPSEMCLFFGESTFWDLPFESRGLAKNTV